MKLNELTIREAAKGLEEDKFSSVDLTKSCLDRIDKINYKINAYLLVTEDLALEQAKESDERRKRGETKGPLDGIPYNLKDVFCVEGTETTAASKILKGFISPYSCTVYERLRNTGAVLLGKTNTDEFTMGSSTEHSAYGVTKNPWDTARVPGGSSGGPAASVAADMAIFSLGTDTGGSIRQPASFCSVTGLKVTYGLVSRYGVISYASSFDTIGPICKNVEDVVLVLSAIVGNDEKDGTTTIRELPDYTRSLSKDIKEMKVGIPKEFFAKGTNKEVVEILNKAIENLEKEGIKAEKMSFPFIDLATAIYYILVKSEASSNLARYDGIKYGLKSDNLNLKSVYTKTRGEGFGPEAKRSIMLGGYALSSGYCEAYYNKASQARTLLKKEYEKAFKKYDLLFSPVSPTPPFKIGEKVDDPLTMYLSDIMTEPINPAGIPAMSVPAGFTKDGLPVGLQIMGPQFGEEKIIGLADKYQKITNWHKAKPKI